MVGFLNVANATITREQEQGFAALTGRPYVVDHSGELTRSIVFLSGTIMMVVGGGMRYDPNKEA